jgi:hypothetical protein
MDIKTIQVLDRNPKPGAGPLLIYMSCLYVLLTCIQVLDLASGHVLATINHDSKVDWLELNPSGSKLLYRDKNRHLHLFDLATQVNPKP